MFCGWWERGRTIRAVGTVVAVGHVAAVFVAVAVGGAHFQGIRRCL